MLPTEDCPYTRLEWFIEGTQPDQEDTVFSQVWINAATDLPSDENTPRDDRYPITVVDLPPIAHAWAHSQGLVLRSDLVSESNPANLENRHRLEIVSPGNNTFYLISNSLEREAQKIHFEVISTVPVQEVHFWLDGERIATLSQPPYETWWALELGEHTLWAEGILQNGDSVQSPVVHFSVGNQE
jgi:membrane carboxypeptidase/penicillin-binding protein PbpC